jgi:hypothetical protein
MPDQPSEAKKTAMKIALGAALGSALGITAALRKGSNERAPSGQETGALQGRSNEAGAVHELPAPVSTSQSSSRPKGTRSSQSLDHPDWEPLPAAHLPRPTYWPVVLAAGVVFLAWGIVTTLAISIIGLALLALALGGWIGELRRGR